jgi:hypothetical protein
MDTYQQEHGTVEYDEKIGFDVIRRLYGSQKKESKEEKKLNS